jgi:hypothetical protein
MRPNFPVWSDYGSPAQKRWKSASKQGTRTSIGPKILLAGAVIAAGVVGIRGNYPQVVDAEWVQDVGTHLPIMSLSTGDARTKRSGIVAAIPLPSGRAVTTGQTAVSSPRPASELPQLRTSVDAVEPSAETAAPVAVAQIPDVEADADAPPPQPVPAVAANKVVVNKKVVRVEHKKVMRVEHHQRSVTGAYAQYGGWGWPGGGWSGFSPFGNSRRF